MIRKLLFSLVGMLFLVSWNTVGQDLPIFPYKLSPSERAKSLAKMQGGGTPSVKIPYLPTNFVCKEDMLLLPHDSILEVMNSSLYKGSTFSVSPSGKGISVDASTGELTIANNSSLKPGVYTVKLKHGTVGYEVFLFAPENSSSTSEMWKTGPAYTSDMSNSFMIDGKEYIYIANNKASMYVEMPVNSDVVLKTWAGDNLTVGNNPVFSGGVAEYPENMIEFYNKTIVPLYPDEDKEIVSRMINLSTVEYGKVEFDDIFKNYDPSNPGPPEFNATSWRGRINYDNTAGDLKGDPIDGDPTITMASFSDNGNLFYVRSKLDASGNALPAELYFIPTLQMLRMAGDDQIPVNPASSVGIYDSGNLLNSKPIRIVDANGKGLEAELGDLVIKNPKNYSYSDFQNYIKGFGLTLDKNDGGIWNDKWLDYLDPASASSKVNGPHSLSEDWEFYFTSSEYTNNIGDKEKWFVNSKIYKAKLDLSDLNDIKLVVQEEFPLNDVDVPITGLGLDQNGCLFFIAGHTQFALVKIYGWGGPCNNPETVTAPFIVIDKVGDKNAQACIGDTYDLTSTVPDFLRTPTAYVHPLGEPYHSNDPVYKPDLKDIFDITYKDASGNVVPNPKAVGIGKYEVVVSQADNGNPGPPNGKFDLQGKCVENTWSYMVDITVAPGTIPDNKITPPSPALVCFGTLFDLEATTAWYDSNVYTVTYYKADGTVVADPSAVVAGDYKIVIKDNCSGITKDFPYVVIYSTDLAVDFEYSSPICSGVTVSPKIISGDITLGEFKIRLEGDTNWETTIGATSININSGEITNPVASTTYEVQYLAKSTSVTPCSDFEKIVKVVVSADILNPNPSDIIKDADPATCSILVPLTIPDVGNCSVISSLKITLPDGSDVSLPTTTTEYDFPYGISKVVFIVKDSKGNKIEFKYSVTVIDASAPMIDMSTFPADVEQCDNEVTLTEVMLTSTCGGGTVTNSFNNNGGNASGTYPDGATVVTFTAKDSKGNVTDTQVLNIKISPISVSIDGPATADDGYEFELKAIVSEGTVTSYKWSEVSGKVEFVRGTENEQVAHVKITGDSKIQVLVTSDTGCEATAEIEVTTNGDCKIPNVITPNGDGYNDVFEVTCIDQYENNRMIIYDRWGKRIFSANNYQNNWDGTNSSGDKLSGTHYYELTSSNKSTRKGYVVVVR